MIASTYHVILVQIKRHLVQVRQDALSAVIKQIRVC